MAEYLLEINDLKVYYPIKGGFFNTTKDYVRAVDGVTIKIPKGKTYGLVGESGSGKTTTGKAVMGLNKVSGGDIYFEGKHLNSGKKVDVSRDVQMIFQDSMSSLDPRKRVIDIIGEPIRNFENLNKEEEFERVLELLAIVGMAKEAIYKYPHEFSGGQRQRIGVARSVACYPKLIIADEPVSALDLSVQAQVLNYMKKIQKDFNLTYIFISHDLGVVRHMCDYIYIMHRGRFVEAGTREDIYNNPKHIYTRKLIASIPDTDPTLKEELKRQRDEVEKEYDEKYDLYYDSNNKVYPLTQISDTHFVALKGGEK